MLSSGAHAAPARLLIRAAADPPDSAPRVEGLLQRLQLRWRTAAQRTEPATATIDIRDLQGRQVLPVHEGQPPLDVELPAGTYDVSIAACDQRRLYTIVLEPGACFELRVHAPVREPAT